VLAVLGGVPVTEAALRGILERARAIAGGERLVGGPRAAAWDIGFIPDCFLGVEWRGPKPQEQDTSGAVLELLQPPPCGKRPWQKAERQP
jgi:hypothetical protein